jgi:hypothetical protein
LVGKIRSLHESNDYLKRVRDAYHAHKSDIMSMEGVCTMRIGYGDSSENKLGIVIYSLVGSDVEVPDSYGDIPVYHLKWTEDPRKG